MDLGRRTLMSNDLERRTPMRDKTIANSANEATIRQVVQCMQDAQKHKTVDLTNNTERRLRL
jgi:hypothetical protein